MSSKAPSQIRTVEIIASLALCVFCAKFAIGVIWTEVKGYKMSRANAGLSALAEQMMSAKPKIGDRAIASLGKNFEKKPVKNLLPNEGTIGNDPWGKPYAFKYFHNENGEVSFLVLVSGGKNAQIETKLAALNFSQIKGGRYTFNGDDFGFIKKIDDNNK